MKVSCGKGGDRPAAAADAHGIEHANHIVKSILHQITEGDAPSGNFGHSDKFQRLVCGNISSYARHGSGVRSSLLSSHSSASDSQQSQSDYGNDATSVTEGSDYSVRSPFASPKPSFRLPPRPPSSSSQKNVSDASYPFLRADTPSYSIGASLMGATPLADLCSWTLQSSSSCGRNEGEKLGTNNSNSNNFLPGVLQPPPLSPLESEESTTLDEEQKSLTIDDQTKINRDSDNPNDNFSTPRVHNGENTPCFDMNASCDDQGFPIDDGLDSDDRASDFDRMDTLNTGATGWSNETSTFCFEDMFGEINYDGLEKDSLIGNGSASHVPTQEYDSSGDNVGSNTGHKPHITMFGSEYARILSSKPPSPSPAAPFNAKKIKRSSNAVSNKIKERFSSSISVAPTFVSSAKESVESDGSVILSLDECPHSVATAAITDVIVTSAFDIPPRGYYRAFQLGEESVRNMVPGRKRQRLFFNVKKELSWDRAAQRPCVTAFCVIYPDRNEFVPPGFSVVRHYVPNANNEGGSKKKEGSSTNNNSELGSSASPAANINPSSSGERVYICYRRSREGNPMTGVTCLRPSKGDLIPEGYTVLERTPRNFVADIAAKSEPPLFLAFRQRLENLECLRPLPLVLSVLYSKPMEFKAYYCTGGTVVPSEVGKYHIMDRSTHSLVSTSSAKSRLNLIRSSRDESETAVPVWVSSVSAHSPSHVNVNQNLPNTDSSVREPVQKDDASESSGVHPSTSRSGYSMSPRSHCNNLHAALDAMHFIPVIECAKTVFQVEDATHSYLESRLTAITPILTSCYISHGASSLVAVEGLTSMLNETNFFAQDVSDEDCNDDGIVEARVRLTILDLAIQAVCDVATCSARETYFRACVDFVSNAVRFAGGKLNDRTIGFVLRFYLFVFYFGASIPTRSWPFNKECPQSKAAILDDFLLFDDTEQSIKYGAPQAAAIALKEFVSIMLSRVGTGLEKAHYRSLELTHEDAVTPQPNVHNTLSNPVESATIRADVANYTQLAMYQIHRSGGSELLWHDMINSIGEGLFGRESESNRSVIRPNIISFAILASFVKICSGRVRMISHTEHVPRDVASKLLSFELLLHFIKMWHVAVSAEDIMYCTEVATLAPVARQNYSPMTYAVRRLVVPTLLSNTSAAIEDCRVYRRILRIITQLWCNSYYRYQMKVELSVLIEHFVLKVLSLGPQVSAGGSVDESSSPPGDMPSLLHQQLDVLEEVKLWFSSNPKDALDLYINYETDGMLPPSYCRIMNKMCEALCNLAEQCGAIISEHGRYASINGGNGSPRRPALFTGENEKANSNVREAAQTMRQKSFDAITAIAKSMMDCASVSSHKGLTAVSGSVDSNDDHLSSEKDTLDGLGLSPQLLPVPSFGDENIIDYWRTSIEKRKAPLQSLLLTSSCEIETPPSLRIKNSMSEESSSKQAQLQQKQETFDVAFELIATKNSLKKGIDFLIASRLLTPSPRQISTFLRIHLSSIDSGLLGDYLGEGGVDGADTDFFNLVRFNFARATSFVGMNIEQALRHFLTNCGFRLPGEAQKIDRIISTFSQCYWEDNAGDLQKCPFQNQDTVFLVSFAIIMLNTDLHKTHMSKGKSPKRMTKNEFITNLRGVYDGVDKFRDYIYSIYDSIESMPIVISTSPTLNKRSKQNNGLYPLPFKDPTDLSSSIHCWIKSVEPAQELLRTFAVRHDSFPPLGDDLIMDITRQMFGANWHHIHGAVNATIDNAHLDLAGLGCCIDVLEHSLCAASYLGLVVERSAFSKLLYRVNRFHDLKVHDDGVRGENTSEDSSNQFKSEGDSNFENFAHVRSLTKQLHTSLSVDNAKIKTMKQVASRIRNGEILLNDTSRCYLREGDLVKHHQLAARSSTYRFFLFSDVLVYAHMSKEGDYKVHEELPLHLMKIEDSDSPSSNTKHNSFHIHHPNKSFLVTCSNKTEKKHWMDDINTSIRQEVKRKAKIEKSRIEAARRAACR